MRTTDITDIVKTAGKRTLLGPGSFDPKKISMRRVLGTYGGQERVTMAESIMASQDNPLSPDRYNLPAFAVTKNLSRRTIFKAESAKE